MFFLLQDSILWWAFGYSLVFGKNFNNPFYGGSELLATKTVNSNLKDELLARLFLSQCAEVVVTLILSTVATAVIALVLRARDQLLVKEKIAPRASDGVGRRTPPAADGQDREGLPLRWTRRQGRPPRPVRGRGTTPAHHLHFMFAPGVDG
jgi:ammonia channel protein AmtB